MCVYVCMYSVCVPVGGVGRSFMGVCVYMCICLLNPDLHLQVEML